MCGIVGLMLKQSAHRPRFGQQVLPMLDCMAERGPDSAGLALFSEPVAANLRRFSLFSYEGETDWLALHGAIEQELHRDGQIHPQGDRASLISGVAPDACPPAHCPGEDFCQVHNGSLSNYHMIRRQPLTVVPR
jgi:methylamine---glutamate N-methyltransferase subunit A